MLVEEYLAKPLLARAGVPVPRGEVAATPEAAFAAAIAIAGAAGQVVVKAQVPAGKRGRSGGVLFAETPEQAREAATRLLGARIAGYPVEKVLVEERADIRRELYAAALNDPSSKSPLVLFSTEGGIDIEEIHAATPGKILRRVVDIRAGFGRAEARDLLAASDLGPALCEAVADVLARMYALYREVDGELVEINPLIVDGAGGVRALDCKLSMDDGARPRHPELVALVEADSRLGGTLLERHGGELGLLYIELDGSVGVLANGAGLTMATMDVIAYHGGRPANFLEIGGEAYTRARPALELVLSNPSVRSLLINFCGAFARTDVMTAGVVEALEVLRSEVPVFFSIHGTGEAEAVRLVRERLRQEPYDHMDDAVKAAVAAAAAFRQEVPA